MLTEVALSNTRSLRAHEKVGFKTFYEYKDDLTGVSWRMVILDFWIFRTFFCLANKNKKIECDTFDPIVPDSNKERNVFAEETTQQIYDLAAPLIKAYPEQWEGWLYIHKVANIINETTMSYSGKKNQSQKKFVLIHFDLVFLE